MSVTLPIDSVSDTAFVTAHIRSIETDRPDAHLRDPYARRLAGTRGETILARMPAPESTVAGGVVRSVVIDEILQEAVRDETVDTVLNLGAGLDTRPYRLPLPPSLRWIDVDAAPVLRYKAESLEGIQPNCRVQRIVGDVASPRDREAILAEVGLAGRTVLVVTEGLLTYMPPDHVADLAADLAAHPRVGWWVTDLVSATAMKLMQTSHAGVGEDHPVRLVFAPDTGPAFFAAHGWSTHAYHSCVDKGRLLQRWLVPESVLEATLNDEAVRRLLGVVVLSRAESDTELE